jgi:hypothetical protein
MWAGVFVDAIELELHVSAADVASGVARTINKGHMTLATFGGADASLPLTLVPSAPPVEHQRSAADDESTVRHEAAQLRRRLRTLRRQLLSLRSDAIVWTAGLATEICTCNLWAVLRLARSAALAWRPLLTLTKGEAIPQPATLIDQDGCAAGCVRASLACALSLTSGARIAMAALDTIQRRHGASPCGVTVEIISEPVSPRGLEPIAILMRCVRGRAIGSLWWQPPRSVVLYKMTIHMHNTPPAAAYALLSEPRRRLEWDPLCMRNEVPAPPPVLLSAPQRTLAIGKSDGHQLTRTTSPPEPPHILAIRAHHRPSLAGRPHD